MMKIVLVLFFIVIGLFGETLSFGSAKQSKNEELYQVQIFATPSMSDAKRLLKKVPKTLKNETYLYKSGRLIRACYSKNSSYKAIKPFVEVFRKSGFHDAFVNSSTMIEIQNEMILSNKNATIKVEGKPKQKKLLKYEVSKMISKANKAYKSGDETTAMIYYEMLIASGYKGLGVKRNLSYLYGKRDAWFSAKNIIDKERYQHPLLYAYAYGAVQNNQKSFYTDLAPYIMIDRSGMLMLLSASYFEKNGDMQKANSFYKMAYEKNPSSSYTIFAYARSKDIEKNYQEATALYKKLLYKSNVPDSLLDSVKKRLIEIGEL